MAPNWLRHDSDNQTVRFRYDFFNEYFKTISLSKFLSNEEFEDIPQEIIEIIINHIGYDEHIYESSAKKD